MKVVSVVLNMSRGDQRDYGLMYVVTLVRGEPVDPSNVAASDCSTLAATLSHERQLSKDETNPKHRRL